MCYQATTNAKRPSFLKPKCNSDTFSIPLGLSSAEDITKHAQQHLHFVGSYLPNSRQAQRLVALCRPRPEERVVGIWRIVGVTFETFCIELRCLLVCHPITCFRSSVGLPERGLHPSLLCAQALRTASTVQTRSSECSHPLGVRLDTIANVVAH